MKQLRLITNHNFRISHIIFEVQFFLKFTYLVSVLLLSAFAIIEIKAMYNLDLFPNIDTPFDNMYFEIKNINHE